MNTSLPPLKKSRFYGVLLIVLSMSNFAKKTFLNLKGHWHIVVAKSQESYDLLSLVASCCLAGGHHFATFACWVGLVSNKYSWMCSCTYEHRGDPAKILFNSVELIIELLVQNEVSAIYIPIILKSWNKLILPFIKLAYTIPVTPYINSVINPFTSKIIS